MGGGRALGFGLIGLGLILGAFLIVSMLATAAGGDLAMGGILLWGLLVVLVAVPLIGAGFFILQRGKQEEVETREFVGRRRVLEQDRLFRGRIASEAVQQAERLEDLGRGQPQLQRAATRLRQVAEDLQGPGYDQAAWYEAVKLADRDVEALGRYDDLVSGRLRRISAQVDALELGEQQDGAGVLRSVQAWERDLDQRVELLRGERAPSVAPAALLAADEPATGADAIGALARGDAVTYEEDDYLVEVSLTYFASGKTWRLHRLSGDKGQRWLYVAPGGLSLAMLQTAAPAGRDGGPEVEVGGTRYRLDQQGAASVTVEGPGGGEEGLAVDYWHYVGGTNELYWHERWPDGPRAYQGTTIRPRSLEVWPRERTTPS